MTATLSVSIQRQIVHEAHLLDDTVMRAVVVRVGASGDGDGEGGGALVVFYLSLSRPVSFFLVL